MRSQKRMEKLEESQRHWKKIGQKFAVENTELAVENRQLMIKIGELEKDILQLADVKRVDYRLTFGISVMFIVLAWMLMAWYFIIW